jgi:uncharacterized membrane protein
MGGDIFLVLRWWVVWLTAGWVAWPLAKKLFAGWDDKGYGMAKILGAGLVSWGVWVLGTLKILPFTGLTVLITAAIVLGIGLLINKKSQEKIPVKLIVAEEVLFLGSLLLWSYVKGHEPTINGLEKFMDYGFTKSILDGAYFPPKDMWFAGGNINYYYFGHLMMAVVTRISGMNLGITFNLMLCTIFALTVTMTWSITRKLLQEVAEKWKILGAVVTTLLMVFAGNLQTIYAFTKGYSGDTPPPFWTIWSNFSDKNDFMAGWSSYWYPNATRFIPYTIHEFPAYSFVVSDVHGHVLDIPIALLCIGLVVNMFKARKEIKLWETAFYGFAAGWAFTTNALDGLIYLGLWMWLRILRFNKRLWIELAVILGIFAISVSPFVIHFKSFVSGLGVDCPPASMINKKIGPLLFETADKCQKSPLWMWLILWGFFWYCGIVLALQIKEKNPGTVSMLLAWVVFALGLTIFPEFFYFKDIYPMHFRSNTMFKLGYQAYILMTLMSGYTITKLLMARGSWRKWLFIAGLVPLMFLVSIYPLFSIKSYFGKLSLENYKELWGLSWINEKYPDDLKAINWLTSQNKWPNQPVILEANGDSYTDANKYSAFTGFPTIGGWLVHEWLWRSYDQIAARDEEIKQVYEMSNVDEAEKILAKYQVKYIIVSDTERQKFANLSEEKINTVATMVFDAGTTKVYQVL